MLSPGVRLSALCLLSLWACPAGAQGADANLACERAALVAETAHGLPPGLLAAVGRVESGRTDTASGRVHPWPYTIDVQGAGAAFPTAEAAKAAVLRAQSNGQTSIDVGCFQVNLLAHPQAFATLQDAFDPARNADYAASFLVDLHRRTDDWSAAIMAYHSGTAALGEPYRDRVLASWTGVPGPSGPALLSATPSNIQIWTPAVAGSAPIVLALGPQVPNLPLITYLGR